MPTPTAILPKLCARSIAALHNGALTVSVPDLLTACSPSRQAEVDELLADPFIAEMAEFTKLLDGMQRTSVLAQIRDMVAHPRRIRGAARK